MLSDSGREVKAVVLRRPAATISAETVRDGRGYTLAEKDVAQSTRVDVFSSASRAARESATASTP